MQSDSNWDSQSSATAAGYSPVALKTSEKPTASETPGTLSSKGRRGLAKVQELVTKPWKKAPEASGIEGPKEGEEDDGKEHEKEKQKKGKGIGGEGKVEEGEGGSTTEQILNPCLVPQGVA